MSESDTLPDVFGEPVSTISRSITRPEESRVKRWFLFDGSRYRVTAVLLLGVLVALLALGAVRPIQYEVLLTETTMVQTIFTTLLSGVILLVSIVVSVASVGITQELTTIGEQADRVNTAIEYRNKIQQRSDIPMRPAHSGRFLAAVLSKIEAQVDALEPVAENRHDSAVSTEIVRLMDDIDKNAKELLETLDRVQSGSTNELLLGLDYDCSWQLNQTQYLLTQHADQLSESDREVLESLAETLRYFLIGREYFKSLYYKCEFSDLSTTLLTVSLPVIVFITYILLALNAGFFPDLTVFGFSPLAFYISLAYTIALAPYVVLTSYIVRAASVTRRTMAAGPFVIDSEI